ncbi:type II toxin-antitoxin system toxin DNA ADP-ribosyl transferase DarT [Andreprevotia chitinilytica]|uniref:type II toxin-antitoxin system toxin DNA ADP-ribosyl transferase DarT n=1 Tax=Andreprevotia chitinilytica TaxID=396808 RepID=UPI00054FF061|nr:DUF4433 domain-containing protein [Andreprevotia chitinilytica]
MSQVPERIFLFHMTAITNLPAIFADGAILAKNVLAERDVAYDNIAHGHIQGRRAAKKVVLPPGGNLHDYVPFYFAPRSPMLMAIHGGKVVGCTTNQADIVYLVSSPQNVARSGLPFVFYDLHAAVDYSTCYDDLARLDQIDWTLITERPHLADGSEYCKYFNNVPDHERWFRRMEVRQAEFLVHQRVPLGSLLGIATHNEQKRQEVSALLSQAGLTEIKVIAKPGWYF